MIIDVQQLIKPISEREPTGANLEYLPEFARLERTALGTPDQRMGDAVQVGAPADPVAAMEQAMALFDRTKDLRVALHLQRALLTCHGLLGFNDGLALLRALVEQLWEGVHPGADPDDAGDFTMRANTVAAIAAPELLLALRQTPLIDSRTLGPISLQDIGAVSGEISGATSRVDASQLEAVFLEQPPARIAELADSLRTALRDVATISQTFRKRAAHELDLGPLSKLLERSIVFIDRQRQVIPGSTFVAAIDLSSHAEVIKVEANSPTTLNAPAVGAIMSRHDVNRALELLCAYYTSHEPSSPVPLLLRRCQRLATLDFTDILKELAPEALSRIELIAGTAGK